MGNDFSVDDLFEGFEDDAEELKRKRQIKRDEKYIENIKDQEVINPSSPQTTAQDLENLFFELEKTNPEIKFKQDTLKLARECERVSQIHAAHNYDNLLRLKVRREFCGKKIFDTIQLKSETGQIPDMCFASLTFEKYDSKRRFRGEPIILPTKRGNFLIPRKRVEQVINQMLILVKDKAKKQSFRINETNYFSLLQTKNKRPFVSGNYYCSKKAEFVLD